VDDGGNSACSTWFDSRTALLNSSSSAVSHSSSNVGVSVEQHPRRRARSITELMRWRSDAWVKPRHALAAYVRRATTVARYIDVLQSRIVQSVAAQHSRVRIALCIAFVSFDWRRDGASTLLFRVRNRCVHVRSSIQYSDVSYHSIVARVKTI